jgi:hypothetical protein
MKQTKRTSEQALERWLLCNDNNGDKQKVAADLSFVVELKGFFFFFLGFLLELLPLPLSHWFLFASFFMRPHSGILCFLRKRKEGQLPHL